MRLVEWLERTKIKTTAFACLLEIDRSYLHRILKGEKVPSDKIMERIREITLGNVQDKESLREICND